MVNSWHLIPKAGISLGNICITFNDIWEDVSQKLDLEKTHKVSEARDFGTFLDNILDTGASIRFEFLDSLFEILFMRAKLYFGDIQFIGSEISIVIQELINDEIKILYDSGECNYICPELNIYFFTHEDVGGDGTEVAGVGICSTPWELTPYIYEVTASEYYTNQLDMRSPHSQDSDR